MPTERHDRGDRAGEDRRQRNRVRRSEQYNGTRSHQTRVCPDCRSHIPYVQDVTAPPANCPDCGYQFACAECGYTLDGGDVDGPAVCPVCDNPLDENAPDPEETFTWDE